MALGSPQNPQISMNPNTQSSELSSLDKGNFDVGIMKYPSEIGTVDVPSYVVFNIYVPSSTQYDTKSNPSLTAVQSRSQNNSDYLASTAGKPQNAGGTQVGVGGIAAVSGVQSFLSSDGGVAERLGSGLGAAAAAGAGAEVVSALGSDIVTLKPKLQRIATSIQIYMPDTVMSSMNHDYGTVSATDAMGKLGLASALGDSVLNAVKGTFNSIDSKKLTDLGYDAGIFKELGADVAGSSGGREILGNLAQASGVVGSDFTALALRSAGVAINPQVELLYRGTQNRSFIFEFRFQPRSAQESQTIKSIIQTFKKYASPSIQKNSHGRYFIVPAQFDITFKFQNVTNPFIPQISTCVLASIDANYAGGGQFATMVDGAPPEITMQLRFTEADIIYRELIDSEGY